MPESMDDEQLSDGVPQDIWHVTIPKEGAPHKSRRRKGVDKWRWSCPPEVSALLKASMQRLNPSIRRGAPSMYCNDVELYPELVPAAELRNEYASEGPASAGEQLPAVPASQPPDDEHLALLEVKVREAELQLTRLRMMADAEQRRLESIEQDIKYRRDEREREVQRSLEVASQVQAALLKDLDQLQAHVHSRRTDAMTVEAQMEGVIKTSINNFATTGSELLNLRSSILAGLGQDRFAEILKVGREIAHDLGSSDIVKMASVAVNAKIASAISEKLGREVDPDAVLRAHVLTGEHFLKRRAHLMQLVGAHPGHVASTMIQLTVNYEDGHVTAEQIGSLFQ